MNQTFSFKWRRSKIEEGKYHRKFHANFNKLSATLIYFAVRQAIFGKRLWRVQNRGRC